MRGRKKKKTPPSGDATKSVRQLPIAERRQKVRDLVFVRRVPEREVAEILKVSKRTISYDVAVIRKEYKEVFSTTESAGKKVDELLSQILESANEKIRQLWPIALGMRTKHYEKDPQGQQVEVKDPPPSTANRINAYRAMHEIETDILKTLQGLGYAKKNLGELDVNLIDIIRAANEDKFGQKEDE